MSSATAWPDDRRITIRDLQAATDRRERWSMLTSYTLQLGQRPQRRLLQPGHAPGRGRVQAHRHRHRLLVIQQQRRQRGTDPEPVTARRARRGVHRIAQVAQPARQARPGPQRGALVGVRPRRALRRPGSPRPPDRRRPGVLPLPGLTAGQRGGERSSALYHSPNRWMWQPNGSCGTDVPQARDRKRRAVRPAAFVVLPRPSHFHGGSGFRGGSGQPRLPGSSATAGSSAVTGADAPPGVTLVKLRECCGVQDTPPAGNRLTQRV